MERVLSFVEVKLYDPEKGTLFTLKTETYEGTYPEWNDNLVVPLKLNHADFNYDITGNLQSSRAVLYFTLFDLVSNISRNRQSTNRYDVLIEKRYLGQFSIPLVTIINNPRQNAVYKVERPLFLFGYFNMKPVFSLDNDLPLEFAGPFAPTYINLALTLDPILDLPAEDTIEYYSGYEKPEFLLNGSNWLKALKANNKFAKRNIKVWAHSLGKTAKLESRFIPRYLKPLKTPVEAKDENAYIKVARYVSLMSSKVDSQMFKDLPNIWSTSQEFIDLKSGSPEDHAVLLCNYFMYIDEQLNKSHIKNYLLFGKGM